MKVLVIDDVPMNVVLVRATIGTFCSIFLSASRGTEGIEIALEQQPDLIFLDLGLPDIDGLEVARILSSRPQTSHIPLIALTARANEESKLEAIASGCTHFMAKPLDVMKLREMVSHYKKFGALPPHYLPESAGSVTGDLG